MTERRDDDLDRTPGALYSRRRVLGGLAGGGGSLLLLGAAGTRADRRAVAGSDDDEPDDDNSGSGGGGSGSDHSGHGGGGDEPDDDEPDDEAVIAGEVPAGSLEVRIVGDDADGFSPATLTVDPGQSVTFVNADGDEHTATGSGFDTGVIPSGGMATVVLDEPGTFAYACQIHPEMTGTIGVRGPDGTVPPPAQAAPPPAGATTVQIAGFAFQPASVSVPVGTTVAWTNADSAPHTVTALDGAFDSGIFDPGGGFTWEFTTPGTFAYRCNLHPQMQGEVIVTGDGPVPASAPAADQPANAAAQSPPEAAPSPAATAGDGMVGAWMVVLTPDAGTDLAPQRALLTLHADGTVAADFAAAGEAAGGQGTALGQGQGVWRDDGDGRYALTVVALLLDAERRFAGTLTLRETGQLDAGGGTYRGTFRLEANDPEGAARATGGGSTEASRIAVEPATATAAATPATSGAAPAAASVEIRDLAFAPATLEVAVGTSVTWTNRDSVPHTATAADGSFDTGQLDLGQSGSVTFDQPGTFAYVCAFHPEMEGTVTVR